MGLSAHAVVVAGRGVGATRLDRAAGERRAAEHEDQDGDERRDASAGAHAASS